MREWKKLKIEKAREYRKQLTGKNESYKISLNV